MNQTQKKVFVEVLYFSLIDCSFDEFFLADEETWTHYLKQIPGFLGKKVWQHAQKKNSVVTVIYWESEQAMKAVPTDEQSVVDQKLQARLPQRFQLEGGDFYYQN